ncbi:MAG: COX15/CtaA family protein [Acidimicrobiia bacterium]
MTRALVRYAWIVLAWNVVVILLGATVRATGSGAGCGPSWPTCHGQLIPPVLEGATAWEFSHRAASGLALLLVAWLALWVRRASPAGHPARLGAMLSVVAIVVEALIGAGLVLFEWVADDVSVARVVSVPLHLVNTLFLLGALTLTAYWVLGGMPLRPSHHKGLARLLIWGVLGMVLVAATGAVTALADTLFPAESIRQGLAQDLSSTEHFLTRWRVAHPVVAAGVGGFLVWLALRRGAGHPAALAVVTLVGLQMLMGLVNLALLTPLWAQLVHLALADALWVAYVWMAARLLAEPVLVAWHGPTTRR